MSEQKSKEEILDRNGFDFDAFAYENEHSAKAILKAMDEWKAQPPYNTGKPEVPPISVGDGWESKFEAWVCESWPENNNESAMCRGSARYAMEWICDNVIRKYENQKPPCATAK